MFIILLKFSDNKSAVSEYMGGHNEWIKKGFEDGVFLLAGSIKSGLGGSVIANNISSDDLETRINSDPFVVHNVVSAETIEIEPALAEERLEFLVN